MPRRPNLLRWIPIFIIILALTTRATAQLVISEFLASNSNSITDENGNHEDWIEIQNTSGSAVSLSGWYLTDSSSQPREWAFPAWTLNAGGYVVVFASGKDRKPAQAVAGQDNTGAAGQTKLHTNFKLSGSGEYLALSKDIAGGGLQVSTEFNPFPVQATDVSYGTAITTTTTSLIGAGAAVKALIPTSNALGSTWQGAAANEPFNTASWLSGTTGVGYGDSSISIAAANLKQRLNSDTSAAIVTDTSGAAHTATNNGAAWVTSDTDTAGRTRAGVMQFVATESDQVSTPASTDFDVAQCTVTFWIRSAAVAGTGQEAAMLLDHRTSKGAVITVHPNGTLFFQATNSGTKCAFSSLIGVLDNQWHHVAVVIDIASGATNTFYIDGAVSGSGTNTGAWSWTTGVNLELGRSHDSYWYKYNGLLDDVRFYNRLLTGTEIAQIYGGADAATLAADIGLNTQTPMKNFNATAYIRVPFNVTTPADIGSLRLTQRWSDGFIAYLNGTQITAQNAPASPVYNSAATATHSGSLVDTFTYTPTAGVLRAGSNVLALQGLNNVSTDASFLMLPKLDAISVPFTTTGYTSSATPGSANSAIRTNIGPFVSAVTKNPSPRPTGLVTSPNLTITAKVLPSLRPLATTNPVQIKYVIMYGTEQTVNMTDMGATVGDPAGTHLFSGSIPTSGVGPGQMLRWRVVASDNTAVTGTAPEFSDPTDTEQYYGTVAVDSTVTSSLPVLYWFIPSISTVDGGSGEGDYRCSMYFQAIGETVVGRFYDNVKVNKHGQTTAGFAKKGYDFNLNEDNRFEWDVTQDRVKALNLLTNYGDKSKTHNAMSHEALGAIGSVHHWCKQVRVQQVTTATAGTPSTQFFSIADLMENGDDQFLSYNGLDDDGALYKMYNSLNSGGTFGDNNTGAEKKTRLYETNNNDLAALVTGLDVNTALATRRQFAYDNLNLPQCVSYFVGLEVASSQDNGHKNFYMYRDSNHSREWSIFPWDVDLSWGRNWLDASGYLTDTIFIDNDLDLYNSAEQGKGENRLYSLMVGNTDLSRLPAPEFRDMVLRRLRTILDTYLAAPTLENRFNGFADYFDPPAVGTSDADLDYNKWGTWGNDGGNVTGGAAVRYHINQLVSVYLPGRRTYLANTATIGGVPLPPSQPANAGDLVTIETIDYNPAVTTPGLNQNHEYFVIRNSNTYAVDISDWQITGAVNFTFKKGTVIPAGGGATQNIGNLFVARDPGSFRLRTATPTANQYCFVTGPYDGQLSARGETLELRDATGTLLKSKSWAAAPTATQNQLRITELNYAPAVPTAAEISALPGVVASDFEYIELLNTGATSLPLTGATFSDGVVFTFPSFTLAAGARGLVVANLAAFQLRYGHSLDAQIAGVFAGNLDNSGEHLQVLDVTGENILDFTYNNSWFPPSEEGGRSLVIRSANPDWSTYDLPQSWALSGTVGGSPGTADADFANVYEGWRWDYFVKSEMPTDVAPNLPAALLQDPNGDGWNNLTAYAFGRSPKATGASSPLTVASVINVSGTNYLAVTFQRRHKALDLTYVVETCGDLTNNSWAAVDLPVGAPIDLGNSVEQVTYRDNVAQAPGVPRFIRVRAVKP